MKKYLIILLALPLALSSCLKDDKDVFGKLPGERMSEYLAEVNTILMEAPNGWEMTYYPGRSREHGGYKIYMKFDGNEDVVMASEVSFLMTGDANVAAKETEKSLYKLDSDYGPTLNFNTENSLFHIFSMPGSIVKPENTGFGGDSEFIIMDASKEKITLRGKKAQFDVELTPIPAGTTWESQLKSFYEVQAQMETLLPYYELVLNGKVILVTRERVSGVRLRGLTIEVGKYEKINTSFNFTETGLEFLVPLVVDGVSISSMKWNNANKTFVDEVSGAILREESFSEVYGAWLGDWMVVSSTSELTGSSIAMDVSFDKNVSNSSYKITGWSIANVRKDYSGIGQLKSDGSVTIANYQKVGEYGGGDIIWMMFFRQGSDPTYYISSDPIDVFTLTLNSGKQSAKVSLFASSDGANKAQGMDLLIARPDGRFGIFYAASGYTDQDFAGGSYTMTRMGATTAASKAFSQYVENLKWEGAIVDFDNYLQVSPNVQ